jgi:hypothetical protein
MKSWFQKFICKWFGHVPMRSLVTDLIHRHSTLTVSCIHCKKVLDKQYRNEID